MIIFVYATEDSISIRNRLGLADYSYFFVMRKFLPVLEALGRVVILNNTGGLDDRFDALRAQGKSAILISFAPPHRTPIGLRCPTFPVFAWEYSSIPNEPWGNEPYQNWAYVLTTMAGAITHSNFAVAAVNNALKGACPVVSLPAPLWDEYARIYSPRVPAIDGNHWYLSVANGVVLDSYAQGLDGAYSVPTPSFTAHRQRVAFKGIIYTAVFNPNDARKNWVDLLSAFCFAFRDNPRVTLLIKLVYSGDELSCGMLWREMKKLAPYRCRVVAVQGYLDNGDYRKLVVNSTYIVNSAHGEGQCLPLMEFMSAGKPAIAPNHTAMADYINSDNAFIVDFTEQWTHWAHDPRLVLRAFRYRINWESLRDAYLASYRVASTQSEKYLQMSKHATDGLRMHSSRAVISARLTEFFLRLGFSFAPQSFATRWLATLRRLLKEVILRNIDRARVAVRALAPQWARRYYRRGWART